MSKPRGPRPSWPWLLAIAMLLGVMVSAEAGEGWRNTPADRAEARARLDKLETLLLTEPSATAVLESWCGEYRIAPEARVVAELVPTPGDHTVPDSVRGDLKLKAGETVRHRHVRLTCGGVLLSEAENWYVVDRLTPAMNHLLDTTDTPFGKVVKAMRFKRRILSSRLLWSDEPTKASGPVEGGGIVFPPHLITNRAILEATGAPIAEVIESYAAGVLGTPPR